MALEVPGWLVMTAAAREYGVEYQALRRLVVAGVFTVGRFTVATKKPPIYLKVSELDAWQRDGIDGVKVVRNGTKPRRKEKARG